MLKNETKLNLNPNHSTSRITSDDAYEDEDVQRYEADSYKLKYGDKWKKLASSVRDVVQPDGTIVREYVIEDPSMLDTLSDHYENENESCLTSNYQNANQYYNHMEGSMSNMQATRTDKSHLYTEHDETYSADSLNYQKFIDTNNNNLVNVRPLNKCENVASHQTAKKELYGSTGRNHVNNVDRVYKSQFNLNEIGHQQHQQQPQQNQVYPHQRDLLASFASSLQKSKSKSTQNLTDVSMSRFFKPIRTSVNSSMSAQRSEIAAVSTNADAAGGVNGEEKETNDSDETDDESSESSTKSTESMDENEEPYDKEVESIHEQGEQLKQYGVLASDMPNFEEPTVEYEIVDEHGNQIMINDAEQLKQLATSVSESVQPDGSIVKEYILNDPQIIEQIRSKMKSNSMADMLSNKSANSTVKIEKTGNRAHIQSSSNISQEEIKRSQISLNKYGSQQQIQKGSPITVESVSSIQSKKVPSNDHDNKEVLEKNEQRSTNKNQQKAAKANNNNNINDSRSDLRTKSSPKSHQSPAFLAQVKQTLSKFREKTSPNISKKPQTSHHNQLSSSEQPEEQSKVQKEEPSIKEKEQFQRFISSASFNDFLQSEKKYFQRENAAIQDITALSQNILASEADQTETNTSSNENKNETKKHNQSQHREQNESHYLQPIQQPQAKVQTQNDNYQYLNQFANQNQKNQQTYQNQYVNSYQNQNQYHNYQNQYMNYQFQHQQSKKSADYENVFIPEESQHSSSMTTNEALISNPTETATSATNDQDPVQPKAFLSLTKNRRYEHKYENAVSFRKIISEVNKSKTIPSSFNQYNNYSNSNNYENVIPSNSNRTNSGHEVSTQPLMQPQSQPQPQPQMQPQLQPQSQQSFAKVENKPKENISMINKTHSSQVKPAIKANEAIKQINHNEFELRTRKGKALKFTITSEDPTESDIEECKAILNQSCENLIAADIYSSDSTTSDSENPKQTKSSSSNTKPIPPKKPTSFDMPKYTASPVIIAPAPSNLKTIDSFSKLSNLSSDSSVSIDPEPLPIKYNRNYTKNSGSMSNLTCQSKVKINGSVKMMSSNENLTNLSSFGKPLINNNNNRIIINGCDNRASSNVEPKQSSRQIIIEPSVSKPKSEENLCSFENYLNMANQPTVAINDSKRVNFKMGNTYTKSTINFPTIENTKEKSKSSMNLRNIFVNNNASQAASNSNNKSLDNLTELENSPSNILSGLNITPEMTQKLLLQLLLQQISSNLTPGKSNNDQSQQQETSYSSCHFNKFTQSQPHTKTDPNFTSVTEDAFHSDFDDTISVNPLSQSNFKRNNSKKFSGKMSFDASRGNANRQQREEYELMQNYGLDGHMKPTDECEKF